MSKIIVKEPGDRLSIEAICKHPWTNIGYDSPPILIPPKASPTNKEENIARKIKSVRNESEFTVYSINPIDAKAAAITAERVEKVRIAAVRKRAGSVASVQTSFGSFFSSVNPIPANPRKISDGGYVADVKSEANISSSRRRSSGNSLFSNSLDRSIDMSAPISPTNWSRKSSKHSIEFPPTARKRSGSFTQPIVFVTPSVPNNQNQGPDFSIKEEGSIDSKGDLLSNLLLEMEVMNATHVSAENKNVVSLLIKDEISTVESSFTSPNRSNSDTITPKGSVTGAARAAPRLSTLSIDTDTSTIRPSTERKYSPRTRTQSYQAEFSIPESGEENDSGLVVKPTAQVLKSSKSDLSSSDLSGILPDGEAGKIQESRASVSKSRQTRAYSASKRDFQQTPASTVPDNIDVTQKSRAVKASSRASSRKNLKTQGESSLRNSVTKDASLDYELSLKSESSHYEFDANTLQLLSMHHPNVDQISGKDGSSVGKKFVSKNTSMTSSSTPSSQELSSSNTSGEIVTMSAKVSVSGRSRPRTYSAAGAGESLRISVTKAAVITKSNSLGVNNTESVEYSDENVERQKKLARRIQAEKSAANQPAADAVIKVYPGSFTDGGFDNGQKRNSFKQTKPKTLSKSPSSNDPDDLKKLLELPLKSAFKTPSSKDLESIPPLVHSESGLRKRAATDIKPTPTKPESQTEELPHTAQSLSAASQTSSLYETAKSERKASDVKSEQTYPTDAEIQSWHDTHKPASVIRTVRFPFHKGLASFELEPAKIFVDLHDCLCTLSEMGTASGLFTFEFKRPINDYYLFEIKVDYCGKRVLKFDAEVCKLWMLKMHGVRLKRIHGDSFDFKYFNGLIVENLGYK